MTELQMQMAKALGIDVKEAQPTPEKARQETVLSKAAEELPASTKENTVAADTGKIEVSDWEFNSDDLPINTTDKATLELWRRLRPPQAALFQIADYDINFCGKLCDYREFDMGYNPVAKQIIFRLDDTHYYSLQCDEAGAIQDANFYRILPRLHNIANKLPQTVLYNMQLTLHRPNEEEKLNEDSV